ncbi:hypothetical protein D8M05_08015 [Oceanobacillus bengalensis]|uniref:Uncharacterized protein n=2 Tax=Oceanobacillus bengalensis TaxID=1435466 RepID=A0A494Z0W9_9BACI|nr:hypothetical protein D8M05_08015 [Oceanobacillus bengalensis]
MAFLFYVIIGLALVGLATQLITSPGSFIKGIFITIGFGVAIFAFIYFVLLRKRAPSNDMKKYKKAVQQSKAKYKDRGNSTKVTPKKQPNLIKKKRTKRTSNHLRVIEGNKTKGKDRATF